MTPCRRSSAVSRFRRLGRLALVLPLVALASWPTPVRGQTAAEQERTRVAACQRIHNEVQELTAEKKAIGGRSPDSPRMKTIEAQLSALETEWQSSRCTSEDLTPTPSTRQ